ncbi:thiamine pyrophosphate-dependent dehydrogenase E1 component subunit alpha [Hyphomicrobium zavarzinii]|jgi:pyruvate dehydrogenase E1 component alpha subunit|uniref:thiamine pyrophosphate-dependent dehydrogenase E1 component subunit alpha n=1 Tax=Hyphomicrobium zavarzinii TaxID=48292 RepID=UPI00036E8117|nr:thiamine pyrophosphate-dependent dehydrogenase E1 component subunit alpha [Hyphomicrobium zavarzinii]
MQLTRSQSFVACQKPIFGIDKQLALYRKMLLIRKVEEMLGNASLAAELPGPVHLYVGQEAIAVGVCDHLAETDWIASTHRGHGHFLAKGGDTAALVAEVFGRETGICRGRGGSMHVADFSRGIIGANGIVAGGLALAAGAAWAAQLEGTGRIAVAFFGDGAANQGVLMETLNLSSLWKLPLILVCENNGFAEFSPSATVTSGRIAERAVPFGVAHRTVDGNNLEAVWLAAEEAVAHARGGGGPILLEFETYRLRGHMEQEMAFLSKTYRTNAEVEERRSADPIRRFREALIAHRFATAADLDDLEGEVQDEVVRAKQAAKAAPWPDVTGAKDFMFA